MVSSSGVPMQIFECILDPTLDKFIGDKFLHFRPDNENN